MTFHWIDWSILAVMVAGISIVAYTTKQYTRSVADFLSANRCAGKYLLGTADGIAGLGAITIIALFEMHYKAGFSAVWWNTMMLPLGIIIALTGWVQYRYRQTRVLTMAQFMEIRYSRRFRVFAGITGFTSGILNFGIFPAVGGRFFQYFCGLPPYMVSVGFTEIDLTYAGIMVVLLAISLAFTFMGGQIAVMVTDFLQGTFCNIALCVISAYVLFFRFDWAQIMSAASMAPADASVINPANSGGTDNFNVNYFLIGVFGTLLNYMAWQGNQGYYSSAESPHAARMGRVIGSFRAIIQTAPIVLLALAAYALMHNPDFVQEGGAIRGVLDTIDNPKLQSQQTVTIAITHILPVGLLGIFGAVMFAAFVSTHDTYLHSWGSIFIQDIVMPLRQWWRGKDEPMAPRPHLRLLRFSIFGVAIFIFLFSLFFKQKQDVLMFFALTGTLYLGWAGWAIIGGLYWKRGNAAGVWSAAVVGLFLAVGGWYLTYFWTSSQGIFAWIAPGLWEQAVARWPSLAGEECPLSAQILYFWSMVITGVFYVGASLLIRPEVFNMDRMLHRGDYARQGEGAALPARGWQALRLSRDFTWDDKVMYFASFAVILVFFGYFMVVTLLFTVGNVEYTDVSWGRFWRGYCAFMVVFSSVLTLWFAVGGTRDFLALFRRLREVTRNPADDGTVVDHQSLVDIEERE